LNAEVSKFCILCFSSASIHSATADGVIQQSSENNSTSASISATTSSELSPVESSDVVKVGRNFATSVLTWLGPILFFFKKFVVPFCLKEAGVSSQPSSSSVASERVGSSIADASLNTRDALDKYQIIAQKVCLNPFACV